MSTSWTADSPSLEEGWPCQRLRIGWSLVLFFMFEVFVGKQLPEVMPLIALGLGAGCLASAIMAIREWKMKSQIKLIVDALERRPR